jgi:small-conductance mechanosensitive channel
MSLLNDLMQKTAVAIPSLAAAIAILIVGLLIANLLYRIANKVFNTLGIDKYGEKINEIDLFERAGIKVYLSVLLSKLLYYFIVLIVIIIASDVLGWEVLSNLLADFIAYIPKLLSALLLLFVGLFIADSIRKLVLTTFKSLGIASGTAFSNIIFYFLLINVALSALAQAEVNTNFIMQNLTLILGGVVLAFAIGYGLASKTMASNMLASLYTKNKLNVGDTIRVHSIEGTIIHIDGTAVTIQTTDRQIIVPQSKLMNANIEKLNP